VFLTLSFFEPKQYYCPLEEAIHYLLECPLYANARMQLFMNITPYTVISIANLLFGSDNLTDENNLIVLRNVEKYIDIQCFVFFFDSFAILLNSDIIQPSLVLPTCHIGPWANMGIAG
jgi:hypothetical protein